MGTEAAQGNEQGTLFITTICFIVVVFTSFHFHIFLQYVYINHATKETQWHHPGDTSKQHRRQKAKKSSTDTQNTTGDLGASGGSVGSHDVV